MKDVHEYSKRLEQALTRVADSSLIGAQDKQLIERFGVLLRAQRLSPGRVEKYVKHLKVIAEMLPRLIASEMNPAHQFLSVHFGRQTVPLHRSRGRATSPTVDGTYTHSGGVYALGFDMKQVSSIQNIAQARTSMRSD
jgi:hypothetical protein